MKISDLKGKIFYVSAIPELYYWLNEKANQNGFKLTRTYTPDVDGVLECRKNVLRDNTANIVREISRKAFRDDVPYISMEEVVGLFLDDEFFPVWICNETSFIYDCKSTALHIPKEGGYDLEYSELENLASALGFSVCPYLAKGIEVVVLPTLIDDKNKSMVAKLLKLVADRNLYAVREDALITEYTRLNKSKQSNTAKVKKDLGKKQNYWNKKSFDIYPNEYLILDTEFKCFDARPEERLVTEIAYLHVKNDKVVEEFSTLVKHDGIPLRSQRKYSKDDKTFLQQAMSIKDVQNKVMPLINKMPVIGWGIREDLTILAENFQKNYTSTFIEAKWLWERVYNKNNNFNDKKSLYVVAREHMGCGYRTAHRALNDCMTTKEVYDKCKYKTFADTSKGLTFVR